MAVVGAKGTFAGPGGTSGNGSSYKRRELVCDEVGQEMCCIISHNYYGHVHNSILSSNFHLIYRCLICRWLIYRWKKVWFTENVLDNFDANYICRVRHPLSENLCWASKDHNYAIRMQNWGNIYNRCNRFIYIVDGYIDSNQMYIEEG